MNWNEAVILAISLPKAILWLKARFLILWIKNLIDEIVTHLCLETGTLTPLLKKLLADKYLEKKRDDKDERRVFVTLTSLGKGTLSSIKEAFEKDSSCSLFAPETKQMLLTNVKLINFMKS